LGTKPTVKYIKFSDPTGMVSISNKTISVKHENVYLKLNLNDLVSNGMSIYEFLAFLDTDDIEEYIKTKFYQRMPRYNIKAMIKLSIAYYFYKQNGYGYEWVVNNISNIEAKLIGFNNRIPSKSLLHDFIVNRIGEKGIQQIMYLIAKKLDKQSVKYNINHLNHDSTPVEASRYDYDAKYNTHYECRMYKAHITMKGTVPLLMTFSNGNDNDSPYFEKHAHKLKELNITAEYINMDSAYQSYKNHALCKHVVGAIPNIDIPKSSVYNSKGSEEQISYWCQKLWKKGGYKAKTIEQKLEFLFNNGRVEDVGAYYRNNTVVNGLNERVYKLRSKQEFVHSHIKGTVKFDVRGLCDKNKKLHIMWSFVSYQLMLLCSMQNGLNLNEFGFIKY